MGDKPAFPFYQATPGQGGMEDVPVPGMTFREWQWTMFAAAAMPLAFEEGKRWDAMAKDALRYADAMLAAIEQREKDTDG